MEENKPHQEDWLEYLQRESWHLELLVSGFSIFLLMGAYEVLTDGFRYINLNLALAPNLDGMVRSFLGISILATWVLTINLVVHVFIRGFWIGAIGLRSVQEKIDIEKLGYSDFFTEKLKERVPSLDTTLDRLDILASVIFSFTFLVVFMFLSLFLFMGSLSLFIYLMEIAFKTVEQESTFGKVLTTVGIGLAFIYFFMGVITAIDTLSLGFFKKYKRLSKLYFPIYKIMGVVTMARIYRSIYYSLISRFSKNKIRIALCVYIVLFFLFPFTKFDQYIFYPDNGGDYKLYRNEYDDLRNDNSFIQTASIPTQIVKGSFLPLFIRYNVKDNKVLRKYCTEFDPKKKDGFNSGAYIGKDGIRLNEPYIREDAPEKALECLSTFYTIQIDSTVLSSEFYFYIHPNEEERGVATMLDVEFLSKGKHDLFVKRKKINKEKEIVDEDYTKIVFWKE